MVVLQSRAWFKHFPFSVTEALSAYFLFFGEFFFFFQSQPKSNVFIVHAVIASPQLASCKRRKTITRGWTSPAVIKGGSGRGERQTFTKFVPFSGHVPELKQDRFHLLAHQLVVHVGRRRGGGLTRGTCVSWHVNGRASYETESMEVRLKLRKIKHLLKSNISNGRAKVSFDKTKNKPKRLNSANVKKHGY